MAPGLARAVLIVAVAWGALTVVLLPGRHPLPLDADRSARRAAFSRWRGLERQLWAARRTLTALETVDAAAPSATVRDGAPTEFVSEGLPPAWRAWSEAGLAIVRDAAAEHPSQLPTAVIVVADTARLSGWFVYALLPRPGSPRSCTSIFTVGSRASRTAPRQRFATMPLWRTSPDLLGTCAFYREFGLPGEYVDEWVRDGGWQYLRHARAPDSLMATRPISDADAANILASGSASLLGCLHDRAMDCSRWLRTGIPRPRVPLADGDPTVIHDWPGSHPLGDFGARAIDDFGREAFARFWTSDAPLDRAFAEAFGADLGEWTGELLRRRFTLSRGQRREAASGPLSLAFVLLCIGAGVARVVRRAV